MFILMFFSALSSATILPGNSELVFMGLVNAQPSQAWPLLLVATLGNTLGGMVSFAMGWGLFRFGRREQLLQRSAVRIEQLSPYLLRFGWTSLLLSPLPVIGDVLCLAAGLFRFSPYLSFFAMLLGKLLRYSLVLAAVGYWGG